MDKLNQLYPLFETLPSGKEKPTPPESFYEDADPEIRSRATVGKTTAKRAITNLCKEISTNTTRIVEDLSPSHGSHQLQQLSSLKGSKPERASIQAYSRLFTEIDCKTPRQELNSDSKTDSKS